MRGDARNLGTGRTGGREATSGVILGRYALAVGMPELCAPHNWKWTPLSDVAQLESGHTPSRRHPEYWDGAVPWIGIKDAVDNHGRTIQDTYQHISDQGLAHSSARLLPANTVCLSRTASVGYVVVMGRPMATSQDFVNWVCGSELDPQFLKYVLLAEHEALFRFASGTTHQTIYYPEAKAFHVCLPPAGEQGLIARILGALDEKIELNRRMNETLEAMARGLFKSWFVDFDLVRAKVEDRDRELPNEIADALPDQFVDSEFGEIPKGWKIGTLSDFATLNPEVWSEATRPEVISYIDLSNTKWGRIETITLHDKRTAPSRARRILRPRDTIVGTVRPGNGSYTFVLEDGLTGSTGFAVLRPIKAEFAEFVYLSATAPENIEALSHLADGGAYPSVRPEVVAATRAVEPSHKVIENFSHIVGPLLAEIDQNNQGSRTLAALRDTLLPKLISGELRVKHAEKLVEAAV
jgi:type I restriction enzyme, S subunit